MDKRLVVKFNGGREGLEKIFLCLQYLLKTHICQLVSGKLKGYDALVNIVLDDATEYITTADGNTTTRDFGLLVCKGSSVMVVYPEDGTEEIANPWIEQ